MNIEEIKRRRELYSALAEGKTMQVKNMDGEWVDIKPEKLNCIPEGLVFRIKPESKYRPFKTQKECWEEMHKHPDFGWVKRVNEPAYISLDKVEEIGRVDGWTFEDIFDKITFTDGEPFGIKEEQV